MPMRTAGQITVSRAETARMNEARRRRSSVKEKKHMARDIILWLAGVPLVVIIGLHLFGFLH